MLPSESPFPRYWWGTSLEKAGLGDVRPRLGTYGRYSFEQLPPLPFGLRGDFLWLANEPAYKNHSIATEKAAENAEALPLLHQSAALLGVRLPDAFTTFMGSPALQQRVRSNTDCFLDLCAEPVRCPVGGGYLVRFLADSQGCVFWYLYLTPDGGDHAVVSSPGFYGALAEQWQDEPPNPATIVFVAESFEAFMGRFWLENEIWFAEWQKTPMPDVGRQYIELYRSIKT